MSRREIPEKESWSIESLQEDDTVPPITDAIKAPFSVKVEATNTPPFGDPLFRDYIPAKPESPRPSPQKKKEGLYTVKAVIHDDRDYIPGREVAAISVARRNRILQVAKEIWLSYKDQLKEYEEACRKVNRASLEEKSDPDEELKKAIAIMRKGPPITKEKAVEMAVRRLKMDR